MKMKWCIGDNKFVEDAKMNEKVQVDKQALEDLMHLVKPVEMTKEEALKRLMALNYDTKEGAEYDLKVLEALGLIKFKEEKEVRHLCSYVYADLGAIKVEQWQEAIVLWVGGEIKWKSWELCRTRSQVYNDKCVSMFGCTAKEVIEAL